jgi:hypothetical protein
MASGDPVPLGHEPPAEEEISVAGLRLMVETMGLSTDQAAVIPASSSASRRGPAHVGALSLHRGTHQGQTLLWAVGRPLVLSRYTAVPTGSDPAFGAFLVELRVATGAREAADVDESLDAGLTERCYQLLERAHSTTDREGRMHRIAARMVRRGRRRLKR